MRPPLIYVAGKFSGKDRAEVERNIGAATLAGLQVAELGGFPVVPHANTAHPKYEEIQPYEFWIQGTTRLLECCDAIFMLPDWESSSGATRERARAIDLQIEVFETLPSLASFIRDWVPASH